MEFKNLKVGDLLELGQLMPDLSSEQVECMVVEASPDGVILEASFYGVPLVQIVAMGDTIGYRDGVYGV